MDPVDPAVEAQIVQAAKLKLEKEAFVSGLSGGTISEINWVTLVAPASILLWSTFQSRKSQFTPYTPIACLIDFHLNALALLSAVTIYSSNPLLLNILLVSPAVLLLLLCSPRTSKKKTNKPPQSTLSSSSKPNGANPQPTTTPSKPLDPLPIKPFVTSYRGTMMIITVISILAVDFRIFPRRFAKVENWGTSLMDLGVGSFVFASGSVAARTSLKQTINNQGTSRPMRSITSKMRDAARHSAPLLILGIIRLLSVKGLDYAEHVAEYGVHWNFFFTLGFLPPFVAILEIFAGFIPHALLALLVAGGYQIALSGTDLTRFILSAPRVDPLSQNREGIFSFAGYLAIFLMGEATGKYILPRNDGGFSEVSDRGNSKRSIWQSKILQKLAIWSVIWTTLFWFSINYQYGLNLSVSRRLANLPYVLWVAAFNTVQIMLFALVERVCFGDVHTDPATGRAYLDSKAEAMRATDASPRLLRAFNRNGLVMFLLANLLTGGVNLSINTLKVGNEVALLVLVGYLGILCGVALLLDGLGISIKL